ncbi:MULTISPECIES: hypothetical protein [unclassified Corallococcus]|uniref:hypothetical protein n=1 Tax=unclassified Corallococcus TaxID=2685029 RepID=UPI001A8D3C6B|nr:MULTISPECIES: hypothetical protein [unclassified Corallococcus]MBN9683583.1 hypothetical protein [Corallococcus sp. NCSPR001]WAS84905.1 hypothetical protein O0N60_37295 [Corallococcus sp. NCRR]
MIDLKATARSSSLLRPTTTESALVSPKAQLSAGPVADASRSMPARGFSQADSFQPEIISRHQPRGMPALEGASDMLSAPAAFAPRGLPPELMDLAPAPDAFAPRGLPPELMDLAPAPDAFAPRGLPPELQNLAPAPLAYRGLPPELRDLGPARAQVPVQAEPPAPQPTNNGVPSANDKRPAGDNRTAAQIVDDSPVLKNLGRQKDIKFEQLCKQTGVDPKLDLKDPKQNADGVYRLTKVLEFIDSAKASTGGDRDSKVKGGMGDGNIEGITKDGDARHGTEAGMLKDFAEKGYSFLGEHQLPTTKDTHVKADGSNKDNFQWAAGEAGKALWFIPGVSNVLTGVGNSEGGFKGVLEGAAKGYVNTLKGAAEGVIGSITKGRANPAGMLFGAYTGALANTEAAPQPVKDIASML